MAGLKRFWADVDVLPLDAGFGIALDGRPVRTPAGARLVLPGAALADAVAAEWRSVAGEVDPRAMPLTGLANAAIDVVAPDPAGFAFDVARYAESDLLCYRADNPAPLVARQEAAWDPLLRWAEARYDVTFQTAAGIVHVAQPGATLARIGAVFGAQTTFRLAALSPLTSLSGSAVIALALADGRLGAAEAWGAAMLDEDFQTENWGEDSLRTASRANRWAQFEAAAEFLRLG